MHFYRNNKEGPSCLLLQKKEWNRLRQYADPPAEPSGISEQKEYIKSLVEKSKAWIKTWPDSELGRMAKYEKGQRKQRKADIAAVKAFTEKRNKSERKHNAEAIREAKEKIFQESCYGKKLLSAFCESKALEARDVQVKFLKELREQKNTESKHIKIEPFCTFALDKRATDEQKHRKCTAIQTAMQNRENYEKQIAEAAIAKEAQKNADLENTQLMKHLLELEAEAEEKVRLLQKEALEEGVANHKKSKQERAKREAEYQAKIEMCAKEKDELNCKIKHALQKIQKRAEEMPSVMKVYETIKQSHEDERKRAEALEEINNKTQEYRFAKQDRKVLEKKKHDLEARLLIAATNKAMAEHEKQKQCTSVNKCYCDRQSLMVKSHKNPVKREVIEMETKERRPPCFGPSNKLSNELKKRMKEQPPWTGVKAKHDEFARHANQTLGECKYKIAGRKVVDEYIKYNGLDSIDVPNYY